MVVTDETRMRRFRAKAEELCEFEEEKREEGADLSLLFCGS